MGTDPAGFPERPGRDRPPHRYAAALAGEIERRWQDRWERDGVLWSRLGHPTSRTREPFPTADQRWLVTDVDYLVQVNGKLRARLTVSAETDSPTVEAAALVVETVAPCCRAGNPTDRPGPESGGQRRNVRTLLPSV